MISEEEMALATARARAVWESCPEPDRQWAYKKLRGIGKEWVKQRVKELEKEGRWRRAKQ